jgi:hypothetical protein
MTRSFRFVPLLAISVALSAASALQTDARKSPALVRVQVMDSTGVAIEGAEVTLMRGLKTVVASARTNTAGEHEFLVDRDSTNYSVVARKVGFSRGDRFFAVEKAAVDARVIMKQLPSLPAVTVTAVDLRRQSYHIDADDIASAEQYVGSALDILRFLKPDMATSRSGSWSGKGSVCPSLENIWVNGRWYRGGYVIPDPVIALQARTMGAGFARMGTGNMTILSEIAPEHIAEMNYRDCFDHNMKTVGSNNALYVTLKPGVGYRVGRGTFIVDDTAAVAVNRK